MTRPCDVQEPARKLHFCSETAWRMIGTDVLQHWGTRTSTRARNMSKRVYTDAYATVRFSSTDLDPADVTAALRLPPDHTHRRGELVLRRTKSGAVVEARDPYPHGMWRMSSRSPVQSPRLSTHIEWLLSELEPKADAVRSLLGSGVAADIFCYSYGTNPRPPSIPRSLRERARALGLPIEIDHYEAHPDDWADVGP